MRCWAPSCFLVARLADLRFWRCSVAMANSTTACPSAAAPPVWTCPMPGSPLPRLQPSRVAPTGPRPPFNFFPPQPPPALAPASPGAPARPEPLVQFLPGAAGIGLVTGHRHPSRPGRDGAALNAAVLALLGQGAAPQPAVASVLAANAEADAGLIAIDAQGVLGWGNSERVLRRSDLGQFQRDDGAARVAILHNSIFSCAPLAEQV